MFDNNFTQARQNKIISASRIWWVSVHSHWKHNNIVIVIDGHALVSMHGNTRQRLATISLYPLFYEQLKIYM